MRPNVVIRYIGMVMLLNAAFMLVSAGVSLLHGMDTAFYPLLLSAVLTGALGAFPMIFVQRTSDIMMKEGYAVVVGAWLMACLVGMFPYLLWGGPFDLASAWFESVSGFTTTGATALHDVEALPPGLLFWRSGTHWIGGLGVMMFALVVIPSLGRNKMTLSHMEMSPLARNSFRYSAQKMVRILLVIYLGMTVCETVLLRTAGMGWFDAVNHSFSTVATGGFSTHSDSLAFYDSRAVEIIAMVFMAISGMHFGLIFATVTGKRNNLLRSDVTRFYVATFIVAGILISLDLWRSGIYDDFGSSLRFGMFEAVSTITATGLSTADTNLWTPFATVVLLYLMFQCACAGSTSGGIKSDRILLAFKVLKARIVQHQHPNAVIRIKLNNVYREPHDVHYATFFIVLYVLVVAAGTMVIAATGTDLTTGFSMAASCMGNVGPGFGAIGSMSDYAHISPLLKVFCTLLMLLGRLEIFGLIQLFLMKWWK